MTIRVDYLAAGSDLKDAKNVRVKVFQHEQGISQEDDFDGLDSEAEQFVAYDEGSAIGTGRYLVLAGGIGKVGRVAVLKEHRGQGVGQAIMQKITQTAKQQGLAKLTLDAQLNASSFYENLGYKIEGKPFDEVGIPHVIMTLDL